MKKQRIIIAAVLAVACMTGSALGAQIQDLVRIKGSESSKVIGMGLVVGLNGTGDGKINPTMRSLASTVQQMLDPNTVEAELANVKNVALVSLTAVVPASGVREGDRVDVHVASLGNAKSLVRGRLFMIPLVGPTPNAEVYAFAEGPVTVEDEDNPTVGVVRAGATFVEDIRSQCVDSDGRITLVLRNSVATWPVANNVAGMINGLIAPDGPEIARAVDQKNVVIEVPRHELANPGTFISQILTTYIDTSQINTGARVVINEKTKTIIITGDVEISPVLISHGDMTISTVAPEPQPTQRNPVITETTVVAMDPQQRGGTKLRELLAAFEQLKVAADDRIKIIKTLDSTGKLHAELIIESE